MPRWNTLSREPIAISCRSAAPLAELFKPQEGDRVEFWCHRMSEVGRPGAGIPGWFRGGLFWSLDPADHYAPGEVVQWRRVDDAADLAVRARSNARV